MDAAALAENLQRWEANGTLVPGEGVVAGHHEPAPVEGAFGLGVAPGGPASVSRWSEGSWSVARRYPDVAAAAGYVFDRLGEVSAARHWGAEEWAQLEAAVALGARLRTAALLLWPEADLRPQRWDLAGRLLELGIEPDGLWWIEDVDGLPSPDELVVQLRRVDGGFAVGVVERGSWSEWLRTTDEGVACRELFRRLISGTAATMGMAGEEPHLTERFAPLVRAELERVLAEVADVADPAGPGPDPSA